MIWIAGMGPFFLTILIHYVILQFLVDSISFFFHIWFGTCSLWLCFCETYIDHQNPVRDVFGVRGSWFLWHRRTARWAAMKIRRGVPPTSLYQSLKDSLFGPPGRPFRNFRNRDAGLQGSSNNVSVWFEYDWIPESVTGSEICWTTWLFNIHYVDATWIPLDV